MGFKCQAFSSPELRKEKKYKTRAQTLKEDVTCMFEEASDSLSKLELIDSLSKLGLSNSFEDEIKEVLDAIGLKDNSLSLQYDLYATSLCFRLLRHYGYDASQDMFLGFGEASTGKFLKSSNINVKGLLELFEASTLGREGETVLTEARLFSIGSLSDFGANSDHKLAKEVFQAMSLPLQRRVEWYNIKKHINAHEKDHTSTNTKLIELAKLNFNLVQASHQEDLKEVSRWWMSLLNKEKLSFSRDRMVESFLYAAGIASEPQHGSLRKWLSKVIKLILIIDDAYDVYGSLEEMECFTNAVERWNPQEVNELPEGIKVCFWTFQNTTEEMAAEIEQQKCWNSVLPYLQKTAELERGDAASSILCHMREANVAEDVAREHIRSLITKAWRNINGQCITSTPFLQEPFKYITNTARTAHFIYQHGDGFGDQDRETRDHVLSNFIEPLALFN
ncbi:hypothetical protein ACH5RR_017725 [Cinchona calisaya]|uniref:Alpha-farnesene synthase n=1 Tax=Cinchona calisaya TaxID=153742 RepID=A0ABD2ZJD4_9GENT